MADCMFLVLSMAFSWYIDCEKIIELLAHGLLVETLLRI